MKYTVERVSPSSVAKVISVAAAFLFVLFIAVALVMSVAQGAASNSALPLSFSNISILMIVMPFIYMIGVYIAAYVAALAFNAATRLVGGIRLELSE